MTIMGRREEGSKENRESGRGDRGLIAEEGQRREYLSVMVGGRGCRETYCGWRDELKGLGNIMERRKDDCGKKEGRLWKEGRTIMERRTEGMNSTEWDAMWVSNYGNDTSENIQIKKCNYDRVNKIQGYLYETVYIFTSSVEYFHNTAVSVIS